MDKYFLNKLIDIFFQEWMIQIEDKILILKDFFYEKIHSKINDQSPLHQPLTRRTNSRLSRLTEKKHREKKIYIERERKRKTGKE